MICSGPLVFAFPAFIPSCQVSLQFSFGETPLTHLSLSLSFKNGHASYSENQWLAYIDGRTILKYWEKDMPFLLRNLSKMRAWSSWVPSFQHIFAEYEHRRLQRWVRMTSLLDHSIWAPALSRAWIYSWCFQLQEPGNSPCLVIWFSFPLQLKVFLTYIGW